jgi:predicted secreted acid phosphatase
MALMPKLTAVAYILGALLLSTTVTAEPVNLSLEKQQLVEYHDSGKYDQDLAAVTKQAMYYLRFRINQNKNLTQPNKLAIVMAVDETALSNYNNLKNEHFGGQKMAMNAEKNRADDPAISYVLSLYQYAVKNKVAVFLISDRPESLRKATAKNLKNAGYTQYQQLFLKPNTASTTNTAYKTQARVDIEKKGYDIAVNLGDQFSDLRGGHADMAFKLANPFYMTA